MSNAPERWVGTAGWSIPRASAVRFEGPGTHLERYSRVLRCAEINSSFHRPHAATTYAKWRDATPQGFRFAVKMPRTITHELKLPNVREPVAAFMVQSAGLAEKRGPILVQLPPSLAFDPGIAASFFDVVRTLHDGPVVCEPRHATWFSESAAALMHGYRVGRVAADPAPVPAGAVPGGWPAVAYFRLHGSPRKYWSAYDSGYIATLADTRLDNGGVDQAWFVFDNTASGAAIENACELRERFAVESPSGARGDRPTDPA